MMFFKSATPTPILRLSISSSGLDSSIAYGPGSVINGSIFLKSSQPMQVQQLSIVFQCQIHQHQRQKQKQEQEQQPSILFSVTELIQLNQQNTGIAYDDRTTVVSAGSHMHLFAIQLPLVNYPPTIAETMFPDACHIDYTLEAFLDRPGLPTLPSDRISLIYLPLVVASVNGNDDTGHVTTSRQHSFTMQQNPDASIQIHARMMQSACCIGEQCKIQLTIDNPTNDKINQIYVTFMTRLSKHHHHHQQQQQEQHPSQYINYHQTIPISVPKQTKDHVSYVSIPIAQPCLPTFDFNHDQLGITLHTDHHIIIGLTPFHHHHNKSTTEPAPGSPTTSSSRFFSFGSFYSNASSSSSSLSASSPLYLPITITTIPTCDVKKPSVPLILHHDATTNSTSPLQPHFISSKTPSPIPTGTASNKGNLSDGDDDNDDQYSVSPSSSFRLDDTCTTTTATGRISATPPPPPQSSTLQQHHLTVPSQIATSTSASSSNAHQPLSSGSTVIQLGTTHG